MSAPRSDSTPQLPLDNIVMIHAQEAANLCEARIVQIQLPQVNLQSLKRLDDRLLAHLDGLSVAGERAQMVLDAELDSPSPGGVFVEVVRALENRRPEAVERLWELCGETPSVAGGLAIAFGWVDRHCLQGVVKSLLTSAEPMRRAAGLTVCAMHRTDPGLGTGPWLDDPDPPIRSRALKAAGELGLTDLAPRCLNALKDEDGDCRFWAVWSAVLLGNRGVALDALRRSAFGPDAPHRERAFRLAIQTMDAKSAHTALKALASDSAQLRWLIQGSGINGDASYVPWLIGLMEAPETARLSGEAFTLITGGDLDEQQLWCNRPENVETGPTENPEDEDVSLDPDEGLMWPDPPKVRAWWSANESRFTPGQRYFMGAPVTRAHCLDVLKNGYQRQRILAAHYLCLLEPGTPLFNTSAPAWRQQRLLARMT